MSPPNSAKFVFLQVVRGFLAADASKFVFLQELGSGCRFPPLSNQGSLAATPIISVKFLFLKEVSCNLEQEQL